jgi:SpoVK/Ycf46/Vps4 family AAA+-type ATPase
MVFTPDMTDVSLLVLCSNIPKRCILLIEDIEKSQIKQNIRGEDAKDSRSDKGVSLSGLLNLLDGLCARDGRILIMNLNDRSDLDASLVRPGRIDETYEFKNASPFQAAEMFQNTYQKTLLEDEIAKLSQEFSQYIPDEQFSPATVQSYLLEYKGKPKEAVKNAGKKFRLKINDQGNFGLDTDQGDAWDQEFACFDKLITERALRNDAQPNDKRSQLSDKLAIWNANHKWHEVISAPETYSTLEDLEIIRKYRDEIFSMFAKDLVILVELGTG